MKMLLGGTIMERKRNQKGFTLIELAIAIAVIAILISGVVVGTKFLSSGAKSSKIAETIQQVQTGAAMCKMKNTGGFTASLNLNTLNTMLTDSLCRTGGAGVPDGNGYISNTIPTSGNGYSNLTVSYNTTAGVLTLTFTMDDNSLAQQVAADLQKTYGTTKVPTPTNNILTVNLSI
jgi:prepilin-type N-terminal cleavage/methylation domain-containing protein